MRDLGNILSDEEYPHTVADFAGFHPLPETRPLDDWMSGRGRRLSWPQAFRIGGGEACPERTERSGWDMGDQNFFELAVVAEVGERSKRDLSNARRSGRCRGCGDGENTRSVPEMAEAAG